jgi:hypothetical protein
MEKALVELGEEGNAPAIKLQPGPKEEKQGAYAWEKGFERTWEDLKEDEHGNLQGTTTRVRSVNEVVKVFAASKLSNDADIVVVRLHVDSCSRRSVADESAEEEESWLQSNQKG